MNKSAQNCWGKNNAIIKYEKSAFFFQGTESTACLSL